MSFAILPFLYLFLPLFGKFVKRNKPQLRRLLYTESFDLLGVTLGAKMDLPAVRFDFVEFNPKEKNFSQFLDQLYHAPGIGCGAES
ncbi:MAG: hypothetical protein SVV80_10900, partial [Planctomycetota bacterium]|nr:hypothetical protein [Planctomycetota bacterium]